MRKMTFLNQLVVFIFIYGVLYYSSSLHGVILVEKEKETLNNYGNCALFCSSHLNLGGDLLNNYLELQLRSY